MCFVKCLLWFYVVHVSDLELVFLQLDCFGRPKLFVIDHDGSTRGHINHNAVGTLNGFVNHPDNCDGGDDKCENDEPRLSAYSPHVSRVTIANHWREQLSVGKFVCVFS
jgi:hypothetical protein